MSAFPSEINYPLVSNIVPSRTYGVRIQPHNLASANTPGQSFRFNTGINSRSFIQPSTMSVNFTLTVNKSTNAPAAGTDDYCLLGSAYSAFSRQQITANGNVLETITQLPELAQLLLQSTANTAELDSMIGIGARGGSNGTAHTDGDLDMVIDASIPLLGMFNSENKYFPLYVSELEIELMISDIINKYIVGKTSKLPESFSITNVTLTYQVIELEENVFSAMLSQYPGGTLQILTSSYAYSSGTLQNSNGVQTLVYPHRFNSIKQVFITCNKGVDKTMGAVNPNLAKYPELDIGGVRFPQSYIDSKNYAQAFNQLQISFGSLYSTAHSGSLTKESFAKAATAYTGSYEPATSVTASQLVANTPGLSNMHYIALDLEKLAGAKGGMYNGVSSIGQSSTISFDIMSAPGSTIPVNIWSHFDTVIEFNILDGSIRAIN